MTDISCTNIYCWAGYSTAFVFIVAFIAALAVPILYMLSALFGMVVQPFECVIYMVKRWRGK